MRLLARIYGYPHEFLHVLALWLIGRRALQVTQTHVDIPDDLSTAQYIFVAGLPALVFWGATLVCALALFSAPSVVQAVIWFIIADIFALGGVGTLGDILLIVQRILESRLPPGDELH